MFFSQFEEGINNVYDWFMDTMGPVFEWYTDMFDQVFDIDQIVYTMQTFPISFEDAVEKFGDEMFDFFENVRG